MNYLTRLLYFISISFSLADNTINIDLITTNDLHGSIAEQDAYFMNPQYPPHIIGGSGFVNYLENNLDKKNSLILDAGNFFQGHPMSVIDSGKTMIEFMNKLNYSAIVPGPDDFVYGAKNLNQLAKLSNFPFLISNLKCDNCDLSDHNFKPYIIKKIKGIKVGILGIIDAELSDKVLAENINGISIVGIKKSLDYWIPKLDKLCDVMIILTSTGVPYDREIVYNNFIQDIKDKKFVEKDYKYLNAIEMGYFSEDVDIIVSGGVSKGYNIPWIDPNSETIIMQNYGNGTSFGHIILEVVNKEFLTYNFVVKNNQSQTLLLDDFYPESNSRDWINKKNSKALDRLYKTFNPSRKYKSHKLSYGINKVNDKWSFPRFGRKNRFDIITWNCEFFPVSDEQTIDALAEAINDFDVDAIAFQEIKKIGWFSKLMELLPNYKYSISEQSSFMSQAIIYKKNEFKFIRKVEPFAENDYNFAGRPPLRVDLFRYRDSSYYSIINLHMKCCDSGLNRRKNASEMLYNYIENDIDNGYSNFIVLGDWNDDLKDKYNQHCFDSFLNDSRFHFATDRIVDDISQATYPKEPYVSFLDHILITESLLPSDSDFEIRTIKMGQYMDGYENYESLISDHFPVFLSFKR